MAKDALALKPLDNHKVFKRWMRSIGLCGMALTGGVPVMQEYYQAYLRAAGQAKPLTDPTLVSGMEMLSRGMKRSYSTIHELTRVSFWRAFGISPDMQHALESILSDRLIEYKVSSNTSPVGLHI